MPTPTVSKELISVTVRVAVAPDLLQTIVDVIQPSADDSVVETSIPRRIQSRANLVLAA